MAGRTGIASGAAAQRPSALLRRLRNRMLLVNMSVLTVVMLAAFVTVYVLMYTNIQSQNDRRLREILPLASGQRVIAQNTLGGADDAGPSVGAGLEGTGGPEGISPEVAGRPEVVVSRAVGLSPEHLLSFVLAISADGELVGVISQLDLEEQAYGEALEAMRATGKESGTITLADRIWQFSTAHMAVSEARLGGPGPAERLSVGTGLTQVAFLDVTDSADTLARLLVTFAAVAAAMLAALFFASRSVANRSIRPLEQSWEKQRQFVADASHELKTPLAVISANQAALVSDEDATSASQQRWISNIEAEVQHMSELVNKLLYLSRVEDEALPATVFDMSETAEGALTTLEALAFEKEVAFAGAVEPGCHVCADEPSIRHALLALLDNALAYTPAGGEVRLVLACERHQGRQHVVAKVENTPAHIPADEIPRLFDRFYRLDPAHADHHTQTVGFGLGLALAKAAAERSGGTLVAASADHTVTFTLSLPAAH